MPYNVTFVVFSVVTSMLVNSYAFGENPQSTGQAGPTMIIVAAESAPSGDQNEFIVLRQSADMITWNASSHMKEKVSVGQLAVPQMQLKQVFERILNKSQGDTPTRRPLDGYAHQFFSLILIEEQAVQTCAVLNVHQRNELRMHLRIVFDNIEKHGPYAKANVMPYLLAPEDAMRALTAPQAVPHKSGTSQYPSALPETPPSTGSFRPKDVSPNDLIPNVSFPPKIPARK